MHAVISDNGTGNSALFARAEQLVRCLGKLLHISGVVSFALAEYGFYGIAKLISENSVVGIVFVNKVVDRAVACLKRAFRRLHHADDIRVNLVYGQRLAVILAVAMFVTRDEFTEFFLFLCDSLFAVNGACARFIRLKLSFLRVGERYENVFDVIIVAVGIIEYRIDVAAADIGRESFRVVAVFINLLA